jgi:hypothetical protein
MKRVNVHVVDTRKKTRSISREVEAITKALIAEIHEHKAETGCILNITKQDAAKITKEMSTEGEKSQFNAEEKVKNAMTILERLN